MTKESKERAINDFDDKLAQVIDDFVLWNYPQGTVDTGDGVRISKSHPDDESVTYCISVTIRK